MLTPGTMRESQEGLLGLLSMDACAYNVNDYSETKAQLMTREPWLLRLWSLLSVIIEESQWMFDLKKQEPDDDLGQCRGVARNE